MPPQLSVKPLMRHSFVLVRVLCGYLFCVALYAPFTDAQTRKLSSKELPPSAYKLLSVNVTGTMRHKLEDVIAASGLQIGQIVHEDDFKAALRLLGETGAFNDLLYSFQYSPEGTKLELQVKDADHFVPARFDNVVWFSDQELLDQLHDRVSLFHGQLPISGNLADQVAQALQGLLIEKKVPGQADYLRFASGDGAIEAFIFTVSGPAIRIRNVEFAGATPAEQALLDVTAKKMRGADYLRSVLRVQEEKDFLPIYLERGYLKAMFGDAQPKVIENSPQETVVDVTFPVTPGKQYELTEIELAGSKSFPSAILKQLIHAQPNQPANAIQMSKDFDAIKQLYGTRGFMEAHVEPKPEMDDAHRTVKYVLQIVEGEAYTMGDLEIRGLDSRTTARLENDWKLRGGDPYDSSYPRRFVAQAYKETSLLGDWKSSIHESLNQKDKTVDVTLRFDPDK